MKLKCALCSREVKRQSFLMLLARSAAVGFIKECVQSMAPFRT